MIQKGEWAKRFKISNGSRVQIIRRFKRLRKKSSNGSNEFKWAKGSIMSSVQLDFVQMVQLLKRIKGLNSLNS